MLQDYGYVPFARRIKGVLKYIAAYQNQFRNPKAEKQTRGYRQVFVSARIPIDRGKKNGKVLRISYSKEVNQHELYLIDETNDQLIYLRRG